MKHDDLRSGIFFLLISVFVIVESLRTGFGKWIAPGPNFLLFWTRVVLGCLSLLLIINTLHKRPVSPVKNWYKEVLWARWGITLISLLVYTFVLEYLGFIICTVIFIIVLMISAQPQRWKTALIVAVVATGASYLLFQIWLKAQLPRGLFGI